VPDSLPAALFRHASERPEEPWLFSRQGWDWTWLPWRSVAARVASWSAELSVLPPGRRAAFAAWPGPLPIALDLALQAAGLLSIPIPASSPSLASALARSAANAADIWIDPAGSEPRELPSGFPRFSLSAWTEEGPSGLGGAKAPNAPKAPVAPALSLSAGGVVLEDGRELDASALVAAAGALEALLPAIRPGRRRRDILVSFRPLCDPVERRLLAWATATGAALLLEADRQAGPASAVWARPTLFHGDARDLAVLRRSVSGGRLHGLRRSGRSRLPFGRLHTILLEGELPPEDRAFWESRGVRLIVAGEWGQARSVSIQPA
jgi:hypothetical protein